MQKPRKTKEEVFVKKGEAAPEASPEETEKAPQKQNYNKKRGGGPRSGNTNGARPPKNDQRDFKEKKERAPRYQYPDNWKEEAKKDVTLETKIPENPKGEALLEKPSFETLMNEKKKLQKKIDEIADEQSKIKNDRFNFVKELKDQNKGIKQQLKEKIDEKKKKYEKPVSDLRKELDGLKAEQTAIEEKIDNLKSNVGGNLMSKKKLTETINQMDLEYNSRQFKAHEEVKFLDQLEKLKAQQKLLGPYDALKTQLDQKRDQISEKSKELKKLFGEMKPLEKEIGELIEQLGEKKKKDEAKEEKEAEGEENKKEKPQREKTEKEIEFDKQLDKLFEERNKLKAKQKELSEKFDSDMLAFEKQQFEIQKLEVKRNYQGYLKREEQRKKDHEDWEKRQLEAKEKEREALKFKYQNEINQCDQLVSILKEAIAKPVEKETKEETKQEQQKGKPAPLEDMQPLIGKKALFKDEPAPQSKKTQKKKTIPEPKKGLFSDLSVIVLFEQLKLVAPSNATQVENSLQQIKEKKEYFEKLRAEEIANAEKEKNKAPEENGKETESAEKKKEAPPKEEAKAPALKEEDFPQL